METEALEDIVKIRIALVQVGEMAPEKVWLSILFISTYPLVRSIC